MTQPLAGLWPPVSTPFDDHGRVDEARLVHHARTLLQEGAHGLAILGTTSEANSLTLDERRQVVDCLVNAGIPAAKLLPGTGACAVDDAVALSRHAARLGCAAILLLPPFYYKAISDDGLFAFVATLIERLGDDALPILLYHIPPIAHVGWSLELIGRLRENFPETVAGLKDSSGDWETTRSIITSFPGFKVFPGNEMTLKNALSLGAAGCISATANVNAAGLRALIDGWDGADGVNLQAQASATRTAVQKAPLIQSVKTILAERYDDATWLNVRPPLVPLDEKTRKDIMAEPSVAALLEGMPA